MIQPKLTDVVKSKLTLEQRQAFSTFLAEKIATHNTISLLSGTSFANEIANFVSNMVARSGKNYEFNLSRQHVAESIQKLGNMCSEKAAARLKNNYNFTSLIIDHWSKGGYNFLGIIARTVSKNFQVSEFLVSFKIANSDKTANGIYENLLQYIHPDLGTIAIISDNCSAMIAAIDGKLNSATGNREGRPGVYKITCLEHLASNFDERVHKIEEIYKIDQMIQKISSYYNYRHKS